VRSERPLTPKQRMALETIRAFIREHHRSPTVVELALLLGRSTGAATARLRALYAKGALRAETTGGGYRRSGTVRVIGDDGCPHCGRKGDADGRRDERT
jgi:hypothetical protein